MTITRLRPVHAALLGWALASASCDLKVGDGGLSFDLAQGRATDEWSRTYSLPPGGRLEIVNTNGSIQVDAASGPQIEVHARREMRTRSDETAQAALQSLQMLEEVAPDRVLVEGQIAGEPASSFGRRPRLSIEYRVRIPAGLTASFQTQNGAVRLDNLDGRFQASTTNGSITARAIRGSVDANSINGGIQLDFASVMGSVTVATVNGGVRLELPADAKAELEAETSNGGVSIDERLTLAGDRDRDRGFPGAGPRRLTGTLNGGGPRIVIKTVNGGVRVTVRTPRGA